MIAAALRGDDPWAALSSALCELPSGHERFAEMLAPSWAPSDSDLSNSTVWGCLAEAVWSVRRATSFEDAVTAAIDLGGDTDTVAAVAGGLAGAIWRDSAIPQRWTRSLHGVLTTRSGPRRYDHADLIDLTHRVLAARPAR